MSTLAPCRTPASSIRVVHSLVPVAGMHGSCLSSKACSLASPTRPPTRPVGPKPYKIRAGPQPAFSVACRKGTPINPAVHPCHARKTRTSARTHMRKCRHTFVSSSPKLCITIKDSSFTWTNLNTARDAKRDHGPCANNAVHLLSRRPLLHRRPRMPHAPCPVRGPPVRQALVGPVRCPAELWGILKTMLRGALVTMSLVMHPYELLACFALISSALVCAVLLPFL